MEKYIRELNTMDRRKFIAGATALTAASAMPKLSFAQTSDDPNFTPALVGKPWDPERNAMVFDAGKSETHLPMS